jgi:hypothetical protein
MRGVRRVCCLALLAGVAAILVVVASAGAGKVRHDFIQPGGTTRSYSAQCPGHEKPTSGGFGLEGDTLSTLVEASHPTEHGWSVEMRNVDGGKRYVSLLFLCAKPDGLTMHSKDLKTKPSDADARVKAPCRNGTKAIGGGGALIGHGSGLLVSSVPVNNGKGWAARWHLSGNRAVQLRSYAICKRVPGYYVSRKQGTVAAGGSGGSNQNRAIARCEDGDELLGGGYARLEDNTFYGYVSTRLGGWQVSAYGPKPEVPFTSFATCG